MDEVEDFAFNASFDNGSSAVGAFDVDFTTGTVSGYFSPGAAFGQISSISYNNGIYTLTGQGRLGLRSTASLTLAFTGKDPAAFDSGELIISTFQGQTASGHLTSSSISVVCFATGTRIRTTRGDVPVEHLRVGDMAETISGEMRPIVWIGHREIACGQDAACRPVRIAAQAFGCDLPVRDLLLSPGHPVLVGADETGEGGHLVPIMCLINGTTIRREPVDHVTYWHVELDEHDILLAEGLPAESYLDWGDRAFFSESADHALTNPDFVVPGLSGRCRPVAIDGPVVDAERRRLDAALALRLATACDWPVEQAVAG